MKFNERFNQWLDAPLPGWTERTPRALPAIGIERAAARTTAPDRGLAWLLVVRPLAAVVMFVVAALYGWWIVAVPAAWLVYGSSLTCVHHLIHAGLGFSPSIRRFWLRTIGLLVAESGHALQVTHLAHHRAGADVPDPEGYIEVASWREMPMAALAFRYRLMLMGLKMAPPARRRRITGELVAHACMHLISLALLPVTVVPWAYLTSIHVASFVFAVLAGKGPQTNWGRPIATPFVRVHTGLGRILFFSHDLHLEHHAAPKVPLPHLRRLRPQLDEALDQVDVLDVRMAL